MDKKLEEAREKLKEKIEKKEDTEWSKANDVYFGSRKKGFVSGKK